MRGNVTTTCLYRTTSSGEYYLCNEVPLYFQCQISLWTKPPLMKWEQKKQMILVLRDIRWRPADNNLSLYCEDIGKSVGPRIIMVHSIFNSFIQAPATFVFMLLERAIFHKHYNDGCKRKKRMIWLVKTHAAFFPICKRLSNFYRTLQK